MPLTYSIGLFFIAFLGEAMRYGGLGLGAFASAAVVSGAMLLVSMALLGRDLPNLVVPPDSRQYGIAGPTWSWGRTLTLLPAALIFCLFLLACAAIFTPVAAQLPDWSALATGVAVQVVVFALAQELFFREALLKCFRGNLTWAFPVSIAAVTLFHLPHGLPAALMAGGGAAAYMALRVAGMNIMAVAAVHGLTLALFGRIFTPTLAPDDLWSYTLVYCLGHVVFAAGVLLLRRPLRPLRLLNRSL